MFVWVGLEESEKLIDNAFCSFHDKLTFRKLRLKASGTLCSCGMAPISVQLLLMECFTLLCRISMQLSGLDGGVGGEKNQHSVLDRTPTSPPLSIKVPGKGKKKKPDRGWGVGDICDAAVSRTFIKVIPQCK